jgi:ubiquinone/menaquinone biosynthesis C-methylase UbiE
MPSIRPNRRLQATALGTTLVFVLGFGLPALGAWTGAILTVWFIGTQSTWLGSLVVFGLAVGSGLVSVFHATPLALLETILWTLLAALLSILPFTLYRFAIGLRQGLLVTLVLPLSGTAAQIVGNRWLPMPLFERFSLVHSQHTNRPLIAIAELLGPWAIPFLIYGSAAMIHWMWSHEFHFRGTSSGARTGWFLGSAKRIPSWAKRPQTLALLRSPTSGQALQCVGGPPHESVVSPSGETFPIRSGIPVFEDAQQLTGSNKKCHRLYEMIGGFYDDSQRWGCALMGIDRDKLFMSYLQFLEIHPGDTILETSVGTGLNLKYLPRNARLVGLDLSASMLTACQANLTRWHIKADLVLGNAEALPFASDSLDVVFHVGGINFFNDRARAIREMIRVAKPGRLILIADETERYVKSAYERNPITRRFYKNRREAVSAPLDLVPPEMLEIHLEKLWDDKFYALTFRKPSV